MTTDPYGSPAAVEAAIKDAAKKAARQDPAKNVNDLIQQAYFDRFLTRIFIFDDRWLLKGGASLLARIPTARATTDLDLFRQDTGLGQALADLRTAAARDLGDFFRFDYVSHKPTIGGQQQPYTEGYRVSFNIFIGATSHGLLNVDLVVKAATTADPDIQSAANALALPRLVSVPYRLYPIVDQIADKVCATLEGHQGQPSSREKDLVDLVLIAATHDIDADQLRHALRTEAAFRKLTLPQRFTIPKTWGPSYTAKAKAIPAICSYDINAAHQLMANFLDPILRGDGCGQTWHHGSSTWS